MRQYTEKTMQSGANEWRDNLHILNKDRQALRPSKTVITAKFGEVQRWSSDSEGDEVLITQTLLLALKNPKETAAVTVAETTVDKKSYSELIGSKVARDFGELGVFVGENVALEYDSSDEAKKKLHSML